MYLNLKQTDYNQHIYRIVSYDRFIELFDTKKNTLVKPKLWDDTFENLALKSKLKSPDGSVITVDTHERLYGQCWTTAKASDAMWRIYSPDKSGIRIRTTIDKLLTSLYVANTDKTMTESCIGKVQYKSEASIMNYARKTFSKDGQMTFGSVFRSLLLKRKAFVHEREIRLIHLDWAHKIPTSNTYSYEIDPKELITQVMIDPRIKFEKFKEIKRDIENKTDFKGDIKRSLLYRLPESITIDVEQNITSQN